MGLNQSMKKISNSKEKKSNEENKVNNNSKGVKYHYIQIPNLNYLSLIMKNKSERKMLYNLNLNLQISLSQILN